MISKPLKSIKPARKVCHARGTAIREISCPATSSITTNCGSLVADERATRVAAGIPMRAASIARPMANGVRSGGAIRWATAAQSTTVAADPQVPGPGRRRPMPKKVATTVAQSGARGRDGPATAGRTPALRSGDGTLAAAGSDSGFTIGPLGLLGCDL